MVGVVCCETDLSEKSFFVVPLEKVNGRPFARIARQVDFLSMERIVGLPILEVLAKAFADLNSVVRRYGHVAGIKKLMEVGTHQQAISDLVFSVF